MKDKKSMKASTLKKNVETKLRSDEKKQNRLNQNREIPKKSGPVQVQVRGVDETGKGIIDYERENIKMPNLIKGEKVMIEIVKKGKYYDGKFIKMIEPSSDRVKPKCKYFYDCGGCQLQHMNNAAQNKFKEDTVRELMAPYGKTKPLIAMENPYYYRNKSQATFASYRKGEVTSGIYKEYTHKVVQIDECIVQDKIANDIILTVRNLAKSFKYIPYNEDNGEGFLRHILVRTAMNTGQVMVVLIVAKKIFPSKNNFVKALLEKHPEVTTIVMNINDSDTSMVLGEKENILYGKGYIEDKLSGFTFKISPKTFYQINPSQTEKLYAEAINMAKLTGREKVLDAYSGIGTISLFASKKAREVLAVEVNKESVKNAIANSKANNIKNVKFYTADAGEFMVELAEKGYPIDVVFMDPPRSGSDENFLSSVVKLSPKKVIYISCNPVTQARDLRYLVKNGYKVEEIQPVDLFPQTYHIESIVLMSKA